MQDKPVVPFRLEPESKLAKRPTKLQLLRNSGPPPKTGRVTERVCDEYLDYLRGECHLSANTIEAYGRDMKRFVNWLGKKKLKGLTVGDISDFVGTLQETEMAPASIARCVVAVRMFFKYLQLEGIVTENPAELIATQKMWERVPSVLTTRQVDVFLSAPRKSDTFWQRDAAMLEVLYATGCRASEVAGLRLQDLQLDERFCKCQGKGSKQRMVPLGDRAVAAVEEYLQRQRESLARRRPQELDWLFLSRSGRPLRGATPASFSMYRKTQCRRGSRARVDYRRC